MKSKQLVEYRESFIYRVRRFFKNLFEKKEQEYNYVQEDTDAKDTQTINKVNEEKTLNYIKVDNNIVNKKIKMRKFLEEIEGNRDALNKLSVDRLRKLEKYYADVIKENEKKIIKAKR